MKAILAAIVAALPSVAYSQACGGYADAAEALTVQFGETRASSGLAPDGQTLVETWANPATGTWSILFVTPDGNACLMLSGSNWTAHAQGVDA